MRTSTLLAALMVVTAASHLNAQTTAAPRTLRSTVFPGDSGRVRANASGATQRAIVDTVTDMHARLELHETTLQPGQAPHPPHRHVHEEMFVVRTGTLEVLLNDTKRLAGPGSVVFAASNELHGIRNAGSGPASYIVMRLDTPASAAMAKAAAAPKP